MVTWLVYVIEELIVLCYNWAAAGYLVSRLEVCISPSMETPTFFWYWWAMWEVQGMYSLCHARGQTLTGTQCKETGARTGSTVETPWMVKHCLSWSPPAMAGVLCHLMQLLQTGNLVKLLKEPNTSYNLATWVRVKPSHFDIILTGRHGICQIP